MAGLTEEIAAIYGGYGNGRELVARFRQTGVLVPADDGRLLACDRGGIRWLLAFTRERELAAWVVDRGGDPRRDVDYLRVRGERLLDVAIPALGRPAGVAVDIAGGRPMFFPPLSGIVPDAVAIDVREGV